MEKVKDITPVSACRVLISGVKEGRHEMTKPQILLDEEDNPTQDRLVVICVPYGTKRLMFHCIKSGNNVRVRSVHNRNILWTFERSNVGWSVHPPLEEKGEIVWGSEMHKYILEPILSNLG